MSGRRRKKLPFMNGPSALNSALAKIIMRNFLPCGLVSHFILSHMKYALARNVGDMVERVAAHSPVKNMPIAFFPSNGPRLKAASVATLTLILLGCKTLA
jgi:hypothetical protein